MFGFFSKKKEILAPLSGECVPLEEVPDEAFSKKMVGDGVAIIPSDGHLVSPVDGTIIHIFDTKHAYTLKSDDGVEILIHIGIDTVKLNGEGFNCKVANGQHLKKGDLISEIDFKLISDKKFSTYSPIIFTNVDNFKMKFNFGPVESGKTPISYY